MLALGRMTYRYFECAGLAVDLSVGAFESHYRVTVLMNGAPSRTGRRRDFESAIRWGRAAANDQLERFGVQPRQLSLSMPAELPASPVMALAAG
ncbi:MAG: hypothetical protein U0556_07280 [Dehalococcoidia bacterium]